MEKCDVLWICVTALCFLLIPGVLCKSLQPPGFIGCFMDIFGRIFDNYIIPKNIGIDATGSDCKFYCRSNTCRYAGIKQRNNAVMCFCGQSIESNIENTTCKEKCRGNADEYCGEPKKIVLYDTWLCATLPCKNGGTCGNIDADTYICTCTGEWKGVNCDEATDEEGSTAAYSLIPITIGAVGIIIAILVYKRYETIKIGWRRIKQIFKVSHNHPGCVFNANGAYTEDETYAMPSDETDDINVLETRSFYAEIYPDILPIPTDKSLLNQSTSGRKNDIGKTLYSYAKISSKDFTTPVSASEKPQEVSGHHYSHFNVNDLSKTDRRFGYSRFTVNESGKKSKHDCSPYSHLAVGKEQTATSEDTEDKTYNRLQTTSRTHKSDGEMKKYFVREKDTTYDYAFAGSKNPCMDIKDDYSHLHQ